MADDKKATPTSGNLKDGNAHDQASKEPAPSGAGVVTTPAAESKEAKDAAKQGHQGVLTQNNQQASDGAHAESAVGAEDPLTPPLTKQEKGTSAYTVKSPNFYANGQGPFQEGTVLYLTPEQATAMKKHVEEQ
jgi:hypothetical protein